jgi:acyl carrier protein
MEEQTLFSLIETALNSKPGSVNIETTSANIEGWDSLGHLSILSALNEELGEEDEDPRLASADSVKEILEILN